MPARHEQRMKPLASIVVWQDIPASAASATGAAASDAGPASAAIGFVLAISPDSIQSRTHAVIAPGRGFWPRGICAPKGGLAVSLRYRTLALGADGSTRSPGPSVAMTLTRRDVTSG